MTQGGSDDAMVEPPEGSWTEHYPELGTGAISFADSTSKEFYELEREAVFKRAWLNVARVEELPRVGSYVTKEIEVARRIGHPGQRTRRSHSRLPQRLPSPGKQVGMERLSRRGDPRDVPSIHLQVPRMALRPRWCPEICAAAVGVLRPRRRRLRTEPGALRRVERLHLHQPRCRAAAEPARVPGPDDHRPR